VTDARSVSRRGRKPKFPPEELRRIMIEASLAKIRSSGVAYGVSTIRLDDIITETGAPRVAAYSLWESDERSAQENLRRETVLSLLRDMPSGNAEATREIAVEELANAPDDIGHDPLALRQMVRRIIRRGGAFNHEALNSPQWRVYAAIVKSATSQTNPDPEVLDAIRQGEQKLVETYAALFGEFEAVFGLRLRAGYSVEQFSMCIFALNDGLANRTSEAFANQAVHLEGDEGDTEEWTLFSLGFMALIDQFFEPRES